MMKKAIISVFVSFSILLVACQHRVKDYYIQPANTLTVNGSIREMNLYPDSPPEFPELPGRAEFVSYCAICHSLKYITIQPGFQAKTWTAEVDKMIHKYQAPIDSVTRLKIINYLVAIKVKK